MPPIRTALCLCLMLTPAVAQDADPATQGTSPIAEAVGEPSETFVPLDIDDLSVKRLLSAPILSDGTRIGTVADVLLGPGGAVTLVIDRGSNIAEGARNRLALPLSDAAIEATESDRLRILTAQDPADLSAVE